MLAIARGSIVDQTFAMQHAVIHGLWRPEYESEDESD